MSRLARALQSGVVVCVAAGCGVETVVHNLDEREANRIVELLADEDVATTKALVDTGRSVSYSISVPASARLRAIRALNLHELPRRPDRGYNEVFQETGLIPTSGEERAKRLAAIEGEIERQLKLIDGILDVQVQIVMPDESALRMTQEQISPTTASVTIRYMPGAGGTKPLSEPQVQAVVAAGVEKLTPDNVVVVMTPGGKFAKARAQAQAGDEPVVAGSTGLHRLTNKQLTAVVVAFVLLVLLLAAGLWVTQIRLSDVKGRLLRLQGEIAKARRKTIDENQSLPPA